MKKILVIEDEINLGKVLSDTFADEGFEVDRANDGKTGLQKIKDNHPDLVILDVLMPEMDGMEVLKAVRDDEAIKDTKIIMLTNSESSEHIYEAMNLGVSDYLTKSDWHLSDLVEKVQKKLEA